ncbi:guanylate kinase [candidate division KSB1 bacterium]|nr:guanylate kinase [candidate division KSB1 bacterium]
METDKGLLVVLASPSGGGKTTLIQNILKSADADYVYSISMTTRPPRNGEIDGKDYWFVSQDEFMNKVKNNEFIEYEQVHDWFYGTPRQPIQQWLNDGKIVLLDLDVHGALHLKRRYAQKSLLIFLQPPNKQALLQRLKKRSTETSEQIARRLERLPEEIKQADQFDIIIVNDDLNKTVRKIQKIIKKRDNQFQRMEV